MTFSCSQAWGPLDYTSTPPLPPAINYRLQRNLSSSCKSKNNASSAVRERSFYEMQIIFSKYLEFQQCFRKCPGTQGCFFMFRKLGCLLGANGSPISVSLQNSIVPHRVQGFPYVSVAEKTRAADAWDQLPPQMVWICCALWACLILHVRLCVCSIQFSKIRSVLRLFPPGLWAASLGPEVQLWTPHALQLEVLRVPLRPGPPSAFVLLTPFLQTGPRLD